MRLFQVVSHLLVPRLSRRIAAEPLGRRRVEPDPEGFRDRVVGGLARQGVAEPIRVAGHLGIGHHEIPLRQLPERGVDVDRVLPIEQRFQMGPREGQAEDGGALEHLPSCRTESVDPRREQSRDRGRDRDPREVTGGRVGGDRPLLLEHRDDLFEEERVAVGDVGDRVLEDRGRGGREQVARELSAGRRTEWFQLEHHGARRSSPRGEQVEQIRARHAQQQDRCLPRPLREVLEDIEERGRRPVHVVEREHEWSRGAPASRSRCGSTRRSPLGSSFPARARAPARCRLRRGIPRDARRVGRGSSRRCWPGRPRGLTRRLARGHRAAAGGHCPPRRRGNGCGARRASGCSRRNSATRRDFPSPALPMRVSVRQRDEATWLS